MQGCPLYLLPLGGEDEKVRKNAGSREVSLKLEKSPE